VEFPYGFFKFIIEGLNPGGIATVVITLPGDTAPDTYYKYGPTPIDPIEAWYNFKFADLTQTGATFDGNVITLHFIDGAWGDDDLKANGIIVDLGGPGFSAAEVEDDTWAPGAAGGCFISTITQVLPID
jgi:hypothetical protein